MKKLSLGKLKLLSEEVLQRSQLVNIYGGSGDGCRYKHPNGEVWCGMSYSEAYGAYENGGGNWCCDSCGSASYDC